MTTEKTKKPKMIRPYSKTWERMANNVARSWVHLISCADCGAPVVKGYICSRCGSTNPEGV